MDLAGLRVLIRESTERLRKDNVVKLQTTARVGYFVARYSCGWKRDMPYPPDELVAIMDEAGTPAYPDPHIRLLFFVVSELYRIPTVPLQRRPPFIESRWYADVAAELPD